MNFVSFGNASQFAKPTSPAQPAALYQPPGCSRKPADEFANQPSSTANSDVFQARHIQFRGGEEESDPASRIFGDQPLFPKTNSSFSQEQVKLRAAGLQRSELELHLQKSRERKQDPYEQAYQKEIQERIDNELKPATTEKKRHSWLKW